MDRSRRKKKRKKKNIGEGTAATDAARGVPPDVKIELLFREKAPKKKEKGMGQETHIRIKKRIIECSLQNPRKSETAETGLDFGKIFKKHAQKGQTLTWEQKDWVTRGPKHGGENPQGCPGGLGFLRAAKKPLRQIKPIVGN